MDALDFKWKTQVLCKPQALVFHAPPAVAEDPDDWFALCGLSGVISHSSNFPVL